MGTKRGFCEFDSSMLHILAMTLMFFDHAWATLFPTQYWMTCIGRIAFPIFAFMIAEGFFYTKDFKKYLLRMVIFAVVSEIPFNLMMSGPIDLFSQNVMWTFVIALLAMKLLDNIKKKFINRFENKIFNLTIVIVLSCLVTLVAYGLGYITFVDYYGAGVLMVLAFYFLRGKKWWNYLTQLAAMYYINVVLLGSRYFEVTLFGHTFELFQQGLGILALIPIWLYKGRKGYDKKWFKYFCYAFYPAHMLILVGIGYLTR